MIEAKTFQDMIGAPYKLGGRDLEKGIDCFGMVQEVARRAGIELPEVDPKGYANPIAYQEIWESIDKPEKALDLVFTHFKGEAGVSIMVDRKLLMTTTAPTGVMFIEIGSFLNKSMGEVKFYRLK